jgi:hypothetical protein
MFNLTPAQVRMEIHVCFSLIPRQHAPDIPQGARATTVTCSANSIFETGVPISFQVGEIWGGMRFS